MKAWKSSSFKVPYLLSKGSNLGGSRRVYRSSQPNSPLTTPTPHSHDKDREDWEAKCELLIYAPLARGPS
jgi:hypothetical protein